MPDHQLQTRYQRSQALPSGEVDGELIALDMERGDCFGLDKVGTEIWHVADKPMTRDEIVALMTQRYDVSPAQCANDLEPFLRQMVECGLLKIVA